MSASIFLAESVVDAAIATLSLNLPPAIATLNAESGATQLVVPALDDVWLGLQDVIAVYPAIEVAVPQETAGAFSVPAVQGDASFAVYVVGHYEDPHPNPLARALYRYASAIARALLVEDGFGPGITVTGVDVNWTGQRPETRDPPSFRGATILSFSLEAIENLR